MFYKRWRSCDPPLISFCDKMVNMKSFVHYRYYFLWFVLVVTALLSYPTLSKADDNGVGPNITSFTTQTSNGTYGPGSQIIISVNFDTNIQSFGDTDMQIKLDDGATVDLNSTNPTNLTGIYTVGALGSGENSSHLTVTSIVSATDIQDQSGNLGQTYNNIPAGQNLGDNSSIIIDTTAPPIVSPTVTTSPAINFSQTSENVQGNITDTGGENADILGYEYGTTTLYGSVFNAYGPGANKGVGSFFNNMGSLTCGTLYHYRAFATNSAGTGYGNDEMFTTDACPSNLPSLHTDSGASIQQTTADLGGTLTGTGSTPVMTEGFQYGTDTNYGLDIHTTSPGYQAGPYSQSISGLICNTQYHFRAYAINSKGTAYGDDANFTTSACGGGGNGGGGGNSPTLTNTPATSVTQTSAILGGNITDVGTPSITDNERGMFYLKAADFNNGNPDNNNVHKVSETGIFTTGLYTQSVTGLACGTDYISVAFATNAGGSQNQGAAFPPATFSTLSCASSTPVYAPAPPLVVLPPAPVTTTSTSSSSGGGSRGGTGDGTVGCIGKNLYSSVTGKKCSTSSNIGSSNSSIFQFTHTLKIGSSGDDIKRLKQFLDTHGAPILGVTQADQETTFFGPKTQKALALYQKINNITPASGFFGVKTMQFVNSILEQEK